MIPVELITLGISTVVGGVGKLMGMRAEANRELMLMAHNQRVELAKVDNNHYQWTRRTIALMVIFAVMVLPKLAALILPGTPVVYGWTSLDSGLFSWLFGTGQLTWHVTQGIVITPLDTNFAMAIAGLYFGSAGVSTRR